MDDPLPQWVVPAWESFLAQPEPRDIFITDLHPLQRRRELEQMLARAHDAEVVAEIGADKGGSLYHWCLLPKVRKVVAVEIRGTPYADVFRRHFPHIEFLFVPASSRDTQALAAIDAFLGDDLFDCVFLDGEKCAFDLDFAAYAAMTRSGGTVFLHDIHGGAPPENVFNILQRTYQTETLIDLSEGTAARARHMARLPVTSSHENWLRTWGESSCGVGCVMIA